MVCFDVNPVEMNEDEVCGMGRSEKCECVMEICGRRGLTGEGRGVNCGTGGKEVREYGGSEVL